MVMANSRVRRPYKGVFPVVPTVFDGDGRVDLEGQQGAVGFVAGAALSAAFLGRMASELENICYFKIEVPQTAAKLRELIALGGEAIEGPWDGEEAITLMADLDAGATGAMTGGGYPDGIRQIID